MPFKILTLNEKKEWSTYLEKLPLDHQDIYYSPEYYKLFENNGEGKALCLVFEKKNKIALYPFLLNSINKLGYELDDEYFDIQGAYGYNGMLYSNRSADLKSTVLKHLSEFCYEKKIVAEFTRFNPILGNHNFSNHISIIKKNKNIIIDLQKTEEYIWTTSYDHSVRKNVKKAKRNGLSVINISSNQISDSWLEIFKDIYYKTLQRNRAKDIYYFSDKYFNDFRKIIKNSAIFFFVMYEERAVSCELVTFKNSNSYSFLGGTLKEYYQYRPNDLLKHEIILHLKKNNVKTFCLGGGISEEDGVYKYKKSFAKKGNVDFFIGKKVYNKKIYDQICKSWSAKNKNKLKTHSSMLLKYRDIS